MSRSDNYFIKNGYYDEAGIDELLEALGERIKEFQYCPAEIEMRGLPYMEPGDVLSVVTRNSGFITYVLRRTISGIQNLIDNTEAEF